MSDSKNIHKLYLEAVVDPAAGDRVEKAMKRSIQGYGDDIKPLWRQSRGDKAKAMEILKGVASHYIADESDLNTPEFEQIFDIVVADVYNGGVEVEWLS